MKVKLIALATVVFAASGLLIAQEKLSLTIEESIQIGLDKSKMLHSSSMRVYGSEAKASEARKGLYPALKLQAGYIRLSDVPPFAVSLPLPPPMPSSFTISPTVLDNYSVRLTLQQPLFTGFRLRGNADMAEYMAQANLEDYEKDKAELIFNIRNAYWGLFKALEFKGVIDENVGQIKAHLQDIRNFMNQGLATRNDVLKVEVQLSNVLLLQIDAENAVRLTTIGLCSTLGLPLDTQIELKSNVHYNPREHEDLKALISKALETRHEVKAMNLRVQAGEAGVTLARGGWFPQIFLAGNYYYSRPNQRILPTKDEFKDTWDVGITMQFDLWNWGTTLSQSNQAEATLAQAEDALSQVKDGITLEVTQNYLSFSQAKEKIDVAQGGVNQAEESFRMTQEKFKQGVASSTELLDSEIALLQAKTNYTQALVDYELAQARLGKSLGEQRATDR